MKEPEWSKVREDIAKVLEKYHINRIFTASVLVEVLMDSHFAAQSARLDERSRIADGASYADLRADGGLPERQET